MRKAIYTALIFLLVPLLGHSQGNPSKMEGKWVFDYELAVAGMHPDMATHYAKMDETRKARVRHHFEGRIFIFNEDGTYLAKLADGNQRTGHWTMDATDKKLIMTDLEGVVLEFDVVVVTPVKMILRRVVEGQMKPAFENWYLNSVKN